MPKPNIKGIRNTNWRMEWDDVSNPDVKSTTQMTIDGKPADPTELQMTIERAIRRKDDGNTK
ncbi:MAG: hypothetical protein E3J35_00675 [Methanomassiliicoccales archaeon]|nr:MAG: hypothetical protein E3J35_00675 [Methanomassiliicoccales archaeon]